MKKLLSLGLGCLLLCALSACSSPVPSSKISGINAMAVLGDSISQASTTCDQLANCPDGSWATGSNPKVNSHLQRIQAEQGTTVAAYNDAVVGAHASDLAGQAQTAVTQRADYVAILMGANDYCAATTASMTDLTLYRQQITAALTILSQGLPQAKIYLASLPDPAQLYEANRGNLRAQQVWTYGGICQSLLANPTDISADADTRRALVAARASAYDTALETACAATPRCHYDGGQITKQRYSSDDVSNLDYFHPSLRGQARIAEESWNAGGVHEFLANAGTD